MKLTREEEKMIEKMHTLRAFDYVRYSELLNAIDGWMQSEIKRYSPAPAEGNKIINFPGTNPAKQ